MKKLKFEISTLFFNNVDKVITKFDQLIRETSEHRFSLEKILRDYARRIKDLEKIVFTTTGITSHDTIRNLEIDGVLLQIDYRSKELYNRDKMIKCIIISQRGNTNIKWTQEKNLTDSEKKYYKLNRFIIVDKTQLMN